MYTDGSEMQGPHGRTGEKLPEVKNGSQQAASKETGTSVLNHKALDSANNLHDFRRRIFPETPVKSPVGQQLDPDFVRPVAEKPTKDS